MDLSYSPHEERFRENVRAFLEANLPPGWGTVGYAAPKGEAQIEFLRDWQRKLYEQGLSGTGMAQTIWRPGRQRGRDGDLQPGDGQGARAGSAQCHRPRHMAGPTIIQHGTDGAKAPLSAGILSADEIWCQGFSEPSAGSDLASLRTRAELVGDEFIVNGQKIWTSYAQYRRLVLCCWCAPILRPRSIAESVICWSI